MKKIYEFMISMPMMGGLFIILAFALGLATFVENDFGTNAAKTLIYHTWWFEMIFLLLTVNLIGNIFRFNLWNRKKVPLLLFHVSFVIIIIGAAITRYTGLEGTMHIREGEKTHVMTTSDTYLSISVIDQNGVESDTQKVFFSPVSPYEYHHSFKNGTRVSSVFFVPNARLQPEKVDDGIPVISILASEGSNFNEQVISWGESLKIGTLWVAFGNSRMHKSEVNIIPDPEGLTFTSILPVIRSDMKTGLMDTLKEKSRVAFTPGMVYSIGQEKLVFKSLLNSARLVPIYQPDNRSLPDAIVLDIEREDNKFQMIVRGHADEIANELIFENKDVVFRASYGAKLISLPFSLYLHDFIMKRYPGSNSPEGYISHVTLLDEHRDLKKDQSIFMNHILNYRGYRFFQSSFDADEKGTILSVNHDPLGTLLTYSGYLLMMLGMLLALLIPGTRFRSLMNQVGTSIRNKNTLLVLLFLPLAVSMQAQEATPPHPIGNKVAEKFGQLWVQDPNGRIEPMNTLTNEIARKLVKHNSFRGLSSDQLILSMLVDKTYWQAFPMITIQHPELKKKLALSQKKASFRDFFTENGEYKLSQLVDETYRKNPSQRNKLEQEVVKADEQVNVFFLVQSGQLLKIYPDAKDTHHPWRMSMGSPPSGLASGDSLFLSSTFAQYLSALQDNNNEHAEQLADSILTYQQSNAGHVLPSKRKLKAEIFYNKSNVFLLLMPFFMALGAILLLFQFISLIKPQWTFPAINHFGMILLFAGLLIYTGGLILRWYVSGHAPWSNGYESMLYSGWATLFAGLLFFRKNPMTASVSALFTSIVLMVSHLSWMNPEITNLVPVLKSYWLTSHVAVIVASYGFLGLGALAGFLNLIVMILKTRSNASHLSLTIHELTGIVEMSLTVGLYLLTVGSFLGGIWANESWGRYWGWDPKETWSAISILVYAFILHLRLIPGMKSPFTFNLWAVIGFSSILMTYLGVNYYLSGMHSYGAGEAVPLPGFVYISVILIALVAVAAFINENRLKNTPK